MNGPTIADVFGLDVVWTPGQGRGMLHVDPDCRYLDDDPPQHPADSIPAESRDRCSACWENLEAEGGECEPEHGRPA